MSPGDNLTRLEIVVFAAAAKHSLKLRKVRARGADFIVYRLSSEHHSSFVDFVLKGGGVRVVALQASLEHEDFLFNRFTNAVFQWGAEWISGVASNDEELSRYSRFGFATNAESKDFVLMARHVPRLAYGAS
jgi:hypothetical protein